MRALASLLVLLSLAPAAAGHVMLNQPSGGEALCPGETYTIEWEVLVGHETENWDLYYSTTGQGGPYLPLALDVPPGDISSGAIHTYDWTVPDEPSNDVWVAVLQDNVGTDYTSGQPVPSVIHGPAAAVFRNGGLNPSSYQATPPVLGGFFSASVDNGAVGQLTSRLFAFDTPVSVTLAGGQTVLCLGSNELFTGLGLAPTGGGGGVDTYSLAVPASLEFCGLELRSQAIQFGNPPFVLSNAQDLVVGGP